MGIKFNSTFNKDAILKKLSDNAAKTLELSVRSEITVLKSRLLRGEDTQGQSVASYAPYSPAYAKKRKEKGRPINKVTWDFLGDFNKSIDLKMIREGYKVIAEIFPKGMEGRLKNLLSHKDGLRAKHWGLTVKQIERIKKALAEFLAR